MPVVIFNQQDLASILAAPRGTLSSNIQRGLVPSLLGSPGRVAMHAFDAIVTTTAELFAKSGGLDRPIVARLMFDHLDQFRHLLTYLDNGAENLVAVIATRLDGKHAFLCGPLEHRDGGAIARMLAARPQPARVCFVSINMAAALVRKNADAVGIDIGDRFGLTAEELAELYVTPARRS